MKRPKSVRILNALDIKVNLERMARAILRQNKALDSLGFIGIRTRGLFLARRLCEIIKKSNGRDVPLGEMDITLYRDDSRSPAPGQGSPQF
jgi:pyrimidine operon attenuation protein/uracil phosphoribosyltransferase